MLILDRGEGEAVRITDAIRVVVVSVKGKKVKLGFDCPRDLTILREEVWIDIQQNGRRSKDDAR